MQISKFLFSDIFNLAHNTLLTNVRGSHKVVIRIKQG